jgi:Ni/Co efflux regulator RcnB
VNSSETIKTLINQVIIAAAILAAAISLPQSSGYGQQKQDSNPHRAPDRTKVTRRMNGASSKSERNRDSLSASRSRSFTLTSEFYRLIN